ncbi:hypothetical protein LUZ63_018833 [Rhynchospora breviuscula]|uniref:Uncharacterized protein n=1 Tax=Rhynchospora breviuscula TaxID=2022672 RepID=A0A9Q0C531_9POAL|nr:hypothetical protein LUZ63_018833 [Rhynchospora breviuscula]
MATTADPRGNPSDLLFITPCYTSSHHHARLILPPPPPSPLTPGDHTSHASSSVPSPPVDDEVVEEEEEETQPVARPWNLRLRRGLRLPYEKREKERARFSVSLTAEEIEEDVYAVTGSRPRRRPKRRPRLVQRQLDALFPGMWLTEITVDSYRVPES